MSKKGGELQLLDDLPAAKTEDKFHHEIYASIIEDIFLSNKPGMSIGLFGKWGQGKSSVVRALKESLNGSATVIVFNAWKASGDSVRRQLLLYVLKAIKSKHVNRLSRFTQTMLPFEFWKAEDRSLSKGCAVDAYLLKYRQLPWWITICSICAGLSFLLILVSSILLLCGTQDISRFSAFIGLGVAIGGPSLAAIVKWWQAQNRFLLAYTEPVSESQKLKYPEQFQSIFTDEVSAFCKRSGRLIVVVDDLDRCNADTVAEALAAIRQFTMDEIYDHVNFKCQFLIPCDEQQVVLALESAGHDAGIRGARYHDYQSEELLRKFFDAVVRMDEMLPDDLSDFAANLAGQIGLEEKNARELIDIAGARDPRQIKKLLNALKISHESIDRRAGKLLPQKKQMVELASTQRLLVALRETVPEAYKRVVVNPALIEGIPMPQPDLTKKNADLVQNTNAQIKRANLIIGRAGSVSEVTATQLIYGRLEPELRSVSNGGLLENMFMTGDEQGLSEALAATRKEDQSSVQTWLQKKVRQTKSDAAARDILRLMLVFVTSGTQGASEMIAPCMNTFFLKTASLVEVFSEFKRYHALEVVWPHIEPNVRGGVFTAIFSNFEKDQSNAHHELAFLLEHAKELNKITISGLKAWMLEGAKEENEDESFVRRMHSHLRSESVRKECYGFAPEIAVVLSGKSARTDDVENAEDYTGIDGVEIHDNWPRYNVITTLLGDSEDHAKRCLAALFTENGQLATPQALTGSAPGFEQAWSTVGRLLSIVSDNTLQDVFKNIQTWLQQQNSAFSLESILYKIRYDAYRLSKKQILWLGQFLSKRLQSQPAEFYIIEFIGKSPNNDAFRDGWKQLVSSFVTTYFRWLQGQPALSQHMIDALDEIHKNKWFASEQAEDLLIEKLKDPNLSTLDPWLDALTPLVADRRTKIRETVKTCIERNERPKQAFAAGTRILWRNEIDAETAAVLGSFFISQQSEIPQYDAEWQELKDKTGAGAILETIQEKLPSEIETLVSYGNAMDMISAGFETLDKRHKISFIDNRILPLVSSQEPTAKQMGVTIAGQIPVKSTALQKHLKAELKNDALTEDVRHLMEEILKKDTL